MFHNFFSQFIYSSFSNTFQLASRNIDALETFCHCLFFDFSSESVLRVFVTFLSVLDIICRDTASEIRVSPNRIVTVESANADNIKDEEGMTGLFPSPPSQDVLLLLLNSNSSETKHVNITQCQC